MAAVLSELRKSKLYGKWIVTSNAGSTKLACNKSDGSARVASLVIKSLLPAPRSVSVTLQAEPPAWPGWPKLFSTNLRPPVQELLDHLRLHDQAEPLLQERLERRIEVVEEPLPALALAVEPSGKRPRIQRSPLRQPRLNRKALRRPHNWPCWTPRARQDAANIQQLWVEDPMDVQDDVRDDNDDNGEEYSLPQDGMQDDDDDNDEEEEYSLSLSD